MGRFDYAGKLNSHVNAGIYKIKFCVEISYSNKNRFYGIQFTVAVIIIHTAGAGNHSMDGKIFRKKCSFLVVDIIIAAANFVGSYVMPSC